MKWIEGWQNVASWLIKYSQEADNYFVDNGMLIVDLYRAIKVLARNDGFPVDGWYTQMTPTEIWLDIEEYIILYQREESERVLKIAVLKPKPGEWKIEDLL